MNKALTIIVAVLGGVLLVLLIGLLVIVGVDVLSDGEATPTSVVAMATVEPTAITGATTTPAPGQMPATFTPLPTIEATNTALPITPDPTETPLPTNTLPPPTATNTPVPIVYPTNPPPPPPDTPVPPPPPPDTRGIVAQYFNLQWDRINPSVNSPIWFGFKVVTTTGGEVAYNMLGVMPKKDGQDRPEWYQMSYGGPDSTIKPEGLEWEDNIKLPESGNYTLRLAICFDGLDACQSGGGTWATLSQEEAITIN